MSTRSLLINYNDYPLSTSNLLPDNGLAYLAGSLMARGHRTTILDYARVSIISDLFPYAQAERIRSVVNRIVAAAFEGREADAADTRLFKEILATVEAAKAKRVSEIGREIAEIARKQDVDFIGVKLWTGSGFTGAMSIAREIKAAIPDMPIFAGGPHIHWFHEKVLDVADCFNIIVDGEGEDVIWMLAEHVEGKRPLQGIPNLIYRRGGDVICTWQQRIEDVNRLADPVYDPEVYPAMAGDEKIKIILLDESRGCPNSCSFCIHPRISGKKWRLAEADVFVDRIARLKGRYGFNAFRFAGSNPPQKLTHVIAERLLKRDLGIIFTTNFHARGLERQTLSLLKKAGCVGGFFGIESGSQQVLDQAMNKKTSVEEMRTALDMCREEGILTVGSVIIPSPMGGVETDQATFDLLAAARPDSALVCFPGLIPGSAWYEQAEKYGFEVAKTPDFFKKVMSYDIDLFTPPILWRPLDGYSLDGKDFRGLAKESFEFSRRLEQIGLVTQVTDEMFIMAQAVGMSLAEIKSAFMQALLTGDAATIRDLVSRINGKLVAAPESSMARGKPAA